MNKYSFALTGLFAAALLGTSASAFADTGQSKPSLLRICADPANLPYSNDHEQGFENKIATVIAQDLHAELSYFWFSQHRSFFRRTLLDKLCDVVVSAPTGLSIVAETRPYFTSSYVAVTRANDSRHFVSFDDPWLRDARIGLQLVGKEGATTPPAVALSQRGLNQHITAFSMWSDDNDKNPQGKIIDAVADGSIDIALVWGPFAGYFAKSHGTDLRVEPILGDPKMPELTFTFAMAMAVRKDDTALRDRIQDVIDRHSTEIAAILKDFGVPTTLTAVSSISAPPAQPGSP